MARDSVVNKTVVDDPFVYTVYVKFYGQYGAPYGKEYAYKADKRLYDLRFELEGKDHVWEDKRVRIVRFANWLDSSATKVLPNCFDYYQMLAPMKLEKVSEVNINLNKQEENIMTNRKIVTVSLIDNDPALDVSLSVVASFDNLVTEDSNEVLFQEILMNPEFDISGKIKEHNEKRTQQVDLAIKKATGNSVTLEPIKLKQLTWSVK